MPEICYVVKRFTKSHKNTIARARTILNEYAAMGIQLTLRSLYYQFVARDWIDNNLKEYKRLGDIVGHARLAGLIDWFHLEDRTRNLASLKHYNGADDAIDQLAKAYHIDFWEDQKYRPEVWIEKDALVGVIESVCDRYDVPYFSCRGYTSLSEMWRASQRLARYRQQNQKPIIFHFGDHDPSGIDMSRDILSRIRNTFGVSIEFDRVALNINQIEEYEPPPNFVKVKDARSPKYREKFGDSSWELDALDPRIMQGLIEKNIEAILDKKAFEQRQAEKDKVKSELSTLADEWNDIPQQKAKIKRLESEVARLKKSKRRKKR